MSTEQVEAVPPTNETVFATMDAYPWDKDAEFQRALKALLGPNPTPSQKETNTIRAKCYYHERKKGIKVDYNAYYAHVQSTITSSSSSSEPQSQSIPQAQALPQPNAGLESKSDSHSDRPQEAAPLPTEQPTKYPSKFAEVVAMIQSGTSIPGIRDIPTTVLSDKATQSSVGKRRKPWEKVAGTGEENQDIDAEILAGGTFGDRRDERPLEMDIPEALVD